MRLVSKSSCSGLISAIVALAVSSGCSSGPSTIDTPSVNPAAAAEKALELYDKDGNRSLSNEELVACPGIGAAAKRYDTNGDRLISRDEIAAHLQAIFSSGVGLIPVTCRVTSATQPLANAAVRFIPDPLLESSLQPALGNTDANGIAVMAVADAKLPADLRGLNAMQPGVYRVEIDHPRVKQPAKPLGCEVDPTRRGGAEFEFRL
jgi:hypothetical protein